MDPIADKDHDYGVYRAGTDEPFEHGHPVRQEPGRRKCHQQAPEEPLPGLLGRELDQRRPAHQDACTNPFAGLAGPHTSSRHLRLHLYLTLALTVSRACIT